MKATNAEAEAAGKKQPIRSMAPREENDKGKKEQKMIGLLVVCSLIGLIMIYCAYVMIFTEEDPEN